MFIRISLLCAAIFFARVVHADFDAKAFFNSMNDKVKQKVLTKHGEQYIQDILKGDLSKIRIPSLPKLTKDARSTAVYKKKEYAGDVVIDKKDKAKFDYHFVQEIYESVRSEKATQPKMVKWMNVLHQEGSYEGVYRGLVLDEYYRKLEKVHMPLKDTMVVFATTFMQNFIGEKYEQQEILAKNFYTLKREVTERALEMVDALSSHEDLVNWYAYLSAKMANDYPNAFDYEVRSNTDARFHKLWAMTYPTQFLKSEVIIKMHQVFNSFL